MEAVAVLGGPDVGVGGELDGTGSGVAPSAGEAWKRAQVEEAVSVPS